MHITQCQCFVIVFEVFSGSLSQTRKRKKKVDKENWSREVNKEKRMRGDNYTGFSLEQKVSNGPKLQQQNVPKPERRLQQTCSSISCVRSKLRHCQEFTEQRREEIFTNFWKNMDWREKKEFVRSSIDIIKKKESKEKVPEESKRNETMIYYLKLQGIKVQVCQKMFLHFMFKEIKLPIGNLKICRI